jgi:hypothetical protein
MTLGELLIHHPHVQLYMLIVGALSIAALWNWLCNPGPRAAAPPPPNNRTHTNGPRFVCWEAFVVHGITAVCRPKDATTITPPETGREPSPLPSGKKQHPAQC